MSNAIVIARQPRKNSLHCEAMPSIRVVTARTGKDRQGQLYKFSGFSQLRTFSSVSSLLTCIHLSATATGEQMIHLSTRIRMIRRWSGLSQRELAERLGVTRGAVANWESRDASAPAAQRLAQLAESVGVSYEWLATGRGSMVLPSGSVGVMEQKTSPQQRSELEGRLLGAFRAMTARERSVIIGLLEAKARSR